MTQREAPPRLQGNSHDDDDDEEEKTSVGAAPLAEIDAARRASSLGAPAPSLPYVEKLVPSTYSPQPRGGFTNAHTPRAQPVVLESTVPENSDMASEPGLAPFSYAPGPPKESQRVSGHAGSSPVRSPVTPFPPGNGGLTRPGLGNGLPVLSPHSGGPVDPRISLQSGPNPTVDPGASDLVVASATSSGVTAGSGGVTQSLGLRGDQAPRENRASPFHVTRSRAYSFVLDARGMPIELGSGRFAKAYLGEERWLESKTDYRKQIVIKILQKGVSDEDHMRFQMEKELLERVQGHPNIVELMCSGENEEISFLPPSIRDKVDTEFMVLERLEMSLEERLKGSRVRSQKEELLAYDMRERLFRVLDYMIPVASAIEYSHLIRNICHRDIKPANILIGLPDPNLRGSTLQVRLADFNVAKASSRPAVANSVSAWFRMLR